MPNEHRDALTNVVILAEAYPSSLDGWLFELGSHARALANREKKRGWDYGRVTLDDGIEVPGRAESASINWAMQTAMNLDKARDVFRKNSKALAIIAQGCGLTTDTTSIVLLATPGNLADELAQSARNAAALLLAEAKGKLLGNANTEAKGEESVRRDGPGEVRTKRSTAKGNAAEKLIAALTLHHEYAKESCLNLEPVGSNALARKAGVGTGSASRFFANQFKGWAKYKVLCGDPKRLITALKLLNDEFRPFLLDSARTPAEAERENQMKDWDE